MIGIGVSLVAQMVKNLPTMQETLVPSLDQEDPLEKGQPTPAFLPREFHGQIVGLQSVRRVRATNTQTHGLYSKFCLCRLISALIPSLVIPFFWYRGQGTPTQGDLWSAFRQIEGGQGVHPVSALSQLTSAQNKRMAIGAFLIAQLVQNSPAMQETLL